MSPEARLVLPEGIASATAWIFIEWIHLDHYVSQSSADKDQDNRERNYGIGIGNVHDWMAEIDAALDRADHTQLALVFGHLLQYASAVAATIQAHRPTSPWTDEQAQVNGYLDKSVLVQMRDLAIATEPMLQAVRMLASSLGELCAGSLALTGTLDGAAAAVRSVDSRNTRK